MCVCVRVCDVCMCVYISSYHVKKNNFVFMCPCACVYVCCVRLYVCVCIYIRSAVCFSPCAHNGTCTSLGVCACVAGWRSFDCTKGVCVCVCM